MRLGVGQGLTGGTAARSQVESRWPPSDVAARQALSGAHKLERQPASVCAPSSSREGEFVAARSRKGQPNKRLKLAAPGLGRIPFVPQRISCASANLTAPAGWGAAA